MILVITEEVLSLEFLNFLNEQVNDEENPVVYLSIDPGKANGVCGYNSNFSVMFMLTITAPNIVMFLHQFEKVKKCIMEGYKVYPNKVKDHIYSDLETPRVIGRVESWAEIKGIELIKQPASIKPTAYKWLGVKPLSKSNKNNHAMDGHVHFMYWAIKNGHVKAEDLIK